MPSEPPQPRRDERKALPGSDPVPDDGANLGLGSDGAHRADHRTDGREDAQPVRRPRSVLRDEQRLGVSVDREKNAPSVPVDRRAPHPIDQGFGRSAADPTEQTGSV